MEFEIKDYLLKNGYETEFDNWTEFFEGTDTSSVEDVMADGLICAEFTVDEFESFVSRHVSIDENSDCDYKLEVRASDWNSFSDYEVTLTKTEITSGRTYEYDFYLDCDEAECVYEALSKTISEDLEGYMEERTAIITKDDKYINAVFPIAFMLSCEYIDDDTSISSYADYHINCLQHNFKTLTDLIGQTAAIAETYFGGIDRFKDKLQETMNKAGLKWEDALMSKTEHYCEARKIREDFESALNNISADNISILSCKIDCGFSDVDISNLALLHKNGNAEMRDKIELLLTDCNFHSVCNDFSTGKYDDYIIKSAETKDDKHRGNSDKEIEA